MDGKKDIVGFLSTGKIYIHQAKQYHKESVGRLLPLEDFKNLYIYIARSSGERTIEFRIITFIAVVKSSGPGSHLASNPGSHLASKIHNLNMHCEFDFRQFAMQAEKSILYLP